MSSSSLNPLPSSDRLADGDVATDSATNFPASALGDVAGLGAFSTLSAGLVAAAETFADGTIFEGFFSSKLKPKKSPGISSLLVCPAFDTEEAELSASAAGCEELDAFESDLFDRLPRFSDFELRSATGSDLALSCGEAFPASTTDDVAAGSSAGVLADLPPPSPSTPARKSQLLPLFLAGFSVSIASTDSAAAGVTFSAGAVCGFADALEDRSSRTGFFSAAASVLALLEGSLFLAGVLPENAANRSSGSAADALSAASTLSSSFLSCPSPCSNSPLSSSIGSTSRVPPLPPKYSYMSSATGHLLLYWL